MKRLIKNFFIEESDSGNVIQFFQAVQLGLTRNTHNVFSKEVGFFSQPYGNINTKWSNTISGVYTIKVISQLLELVNHKRYFLWEDYIKKFLDHLTTIDNFIYPANFVHKVIYHLSDNTLEMIINQKYLKVPTIKWEGKISVEEYINNYGKLVNIYQKKTFEEMMTEFINQVKLFKQTVYETRSKIS